MKYIRTKDGIFDNWLMDGVIPERISAQTFGIEVIKYANNIEELCDKFVDTGYTDTDGDGWLYDEFDSKNKCLVYYVEDTKRTISLNEFDDLSEICGAIFTDKGLIYKARMKGILPNGEIDWELL